VEGYRYDKACERRRKHGAKYCLGAIDNFRFSGSIQDAEGLLGKVRLYANSPIAFTHFLVDFLSKN
jgi:hypothetical protein